jgi:parallel beta-helix repeat protein
VYDQYSNKGMVNNNIIRNSKIYGNGINGRGPGIILSSGSGNEAYDNEIWENIGGIQIDYGAVDTKVHDNVIYRNSGFGIYIGEGSYNADVENNDVYDNDGPEIAEYGFGTIILPLAAVSN